MIINNRIIEKISCKISIAEALRYWEQIGRLRKRQCDKNNQTPVNDEQNQIF